MVVVLMYGAGADGSAAWPPRMRRPGHRFMERSGSVADDPVADANRIVHDSRAQPVHVVAVSFGGIAAILAAHLAPSRVLSLSLFEPACAHLARQARSVQSLRRRFEPVVAMRDDHTVDDLTYFAAFGTAMGSSRPLAPQTRSEARRLRRSPLPWEVAIPNGQLPVPTLVVTGGWSDFYEDIADALAAKGAARHTLRGFGHAVINHPRAIDLVDEFMLTSQSDTP